MPLLVTVSFHEFSRPFQHGFQELSCIRLWYSADIFRRPRSDDRTTSVTAFRAQINEIISCFDDIEIMFNDNDRISAIDEELQDIHQLVDIRRMQPRRRFVEDIQRAPGTSLGKLCRQFYPLCFSAG